MQPDVDKVRERLIQVLTHDKLLTRVFPFTGDLERAKLSRARLLIKNAKDNNANLTQAIEAAVGIEMVHLATLIHDDVIDDSDLRRNEQSFRAIKGDKGAVLYGDYLFSSAVQHIQRTQNHECTGVFVDCISNTCRGEAIQDLLLTSPEYTPCLEDILDVARSKTGALFSFCTEGPAWMGNNVSGSLKQALKEIGYLLGLAYQLADDVLDICGAEENLGKPAGNDLQKDCITTPLFLFMQELEMDWLAFRAHYSSAENDIKSDFMESESFIEIKLQIKTIKDRLNDNMDICEKEHWKINDVVHYFWSSYVENRIKLLKDG